MDSSSRPDRPAFRRLLARRIATSNPFYAISAALVVLGLRTTFHLPARAVPYPTLTLLLSLAAYTLLLAATAAVLVRRGSVWEDVRMILLIVVALLLCSSVFLDDILEKSPGRGVEFAIGSLVFAVALSEGLLRAIRLRLPLAYRVPYHLALALFFLYPCALTPLLADPGDPRILWGLFGFAPSAGIVALSLIPAIRLGSDHVRENGSPWPWPWYPWSLFGVLAIGVVGRSYSLCLSVHYTNAVDQYMPASASIFAPYFLVPFGLACAVLLLELAKKSGSQILLNSAIFAPVVLMAMATIGLGHDGVARRFLRMLSEDLGGSPLYLTTLSSIAFFSYAAIRKVSLALDAIAASLVSLAVIGPETRTFLELEAPRGVALWAASVPLAWLSIRRKNRVIGLLAAFSASAAVVFAPEGAAPIADRSVIAFHLGMGLALLILSGRSSRLGRIGLASGSVHLSVAFFAWSTGIPGFPPGLPSSIARAYPTILLVIVAWFAVFQLLRRPGIVLAADLVGWFAAAGWELAFPLRRISAGAGQLALGLAFFLLAAGISLRKAEATAATKPPPKRPALD